MNNLYKRFWIEFELKKEIKYPWQVVANYGVTAFDFQDAMTILKNQIFIDIEIPKIIKCIENVDIRDLDQEHVVPNMAPPIYRGIWYPLGYQDNNIR